MKLNNHSYVHVQMRQFCLQLELLSGMTMITNLSEEFKQITFVDKLGYIVIDYKRKTCLTLCHKLTKAETATIDDIMCRWGWLETGHKVEKLLQKRRKKTCNKNVTKKISRNTLQEKKDSIISNHK